MNELSLKIDSGPTIDEDIETYPKVSKKGIIGELTKERIETFFREQPNVTEERFDEEIDSEVSISTIPFAKNYNNPIAIIPDDISVFHTFKTLATWEGYVVSVEDESFTARIVDSSGKTPDEEVEIEIEDISIDDRELIQDGAIFNLHIGKENRNGTIKKSSIITFRRMPRWTKSDFKKAEKTEKKLISLLGLH